MVTCKEYQLVLVFALDLIHSHPADHKDLTRGKKPSTELNMPILLHSTSVALFCATAVFAQQPCPPLGPILPAPVTLNGLRNATQPFHAQLQNSTSAFKNATALSIGVKSIHDVEPLLSFHITPSHFNQSGTGEVTGDTVYAIGSVTKLFTALAVLQLDGKIDVSAPVTRYVPRLEHLSTSEDPLLAVDWQSVTVEALLSQLSGIAADRMRSHYTIGPEVPRTNDI
jgi:CubicO group peptidase (beta-lactamase class C family)